MDPAPIALALAIGARESGTEIREGAGTPRSLLQRLAQRYGRDQEAVALLVALSRALGLWDPSALSRAVPPGSFTVSAMAAALFSVWRKGGAWDEARPEPEVLRLPPDARDSSPVGVVRDIVIDALEDLGEGHWVPFEALADYVRNDHRTPGVTRLLRRWAQRVALEPPTPTDIAQRIVLESLPALGLVDLGEGELDDDLQGTWPLVRITPRGRAVLQASPSTADPTPTAFVDDTTLRIGDDASVAAVLALYAFAEVGQVSNVLEFEVSAAAISRAVAAGVDGQLIGASIENLAKPSPAVARALEQLSVVLGRVDICSDDGVRVVRRRRRARDAAFAPRHGGLVH